MQHSNIFNTIHGETRKRTKACWQQCQGSERVALWSRIQNYKNVRSLNSPVCVFPNALSFFF